MGSEASSSTLRLELRPEPGAVARFVALTLLAPSYLRVPFAFLPACAENIFSTTVEKDAKDGEGKDESTAPPG